MFERFTQPSRRVVVLAQEEARMLDHNYIGTEHILLGLIHEGEGVAARAIVSLGLTLEMARDQVTDMIGRGQQTPSGHIPFTPRAKKVLELSLREALALKSDYIDTEHILLGLVREGDGVGAQILDRVAPLLAVRETVLELAPPKRPRRPGRSGTSRWRWSGRLWGRQRSASGGRPGPSSTSGPRWSPSSGRRWRRSARRWRRSSSGWTASSASSASGRGGPGGGGVGTGGGRPGAAPGDAAQAPGDAAQAPGTEDRRAGARTKHGGGRRNRTGVGRNGPEESPE